MEYTNDKANRTLESVINVNQYIVVKGIRKRFKEKLILKADGELKFNSTFLKKTSERRYAVAFSKDFKEVFVVPGCMPEILFSKNGNAKDIDLARMLKTKNKQLFPRIYELEWDDKRQLWCGRPDQSTKA